MVSTTLWHVEQEVEILQTIGRVTVRWAALDVMLAQILEIACQNYAIANDLVFGSNDAGKKRLEKFDRAIGACRFDEGERTELLNITGRIAGLLGTRNKLVHAPLDVAYTVSLSENKLQKYIVSREKSGRAKAFSMAAAESHLNELMSALHELERLRDALLSKYDEAKND